MPNEDKSFPVIVQLIALVVIAFQLNLNYLRMSLNSEIA
jgi:hypothetical protein